MNQEPINSSLGIVLLLEIDKRLFDCTQLTLVVEKKATLQNSTQSPILIEDLNYSCQLTHMRL